MSVEEVPPQLAPCSVTGKLVPVDELVTIQGQRVCAEGKAILLERLKAGETMPGELERPTVLRRFGCIFLDGLIIGIPTGILQWVVGAMSGSSAVVGLVALGSTALQIVYFAQMHASRGQTVGKIAGKLKVVDLDGSPISVGTAYLRALVYTGPSFLAGAGLIAGSLQLAQIANGIVGIWGLANVLFALIDSKYQRCLHDRIAGTRVVVKD